MLLSGGFNFIWLWAAILWEFDPLILKGFSKLSNYFIFYIILVIYSDFLFSRFLISLHFEKFFVHFALDRQSLASWIIIQRRLPHINWELRGNSFTKLFIPKLPRIDLGLLFGKLGNPLNKIWLFFAVFFFVRGIVCRWRMTFAVDKVDCWLFIYSSQLFSRGFGLSCFFVWSAEGTVIHKLIITMKNHLNNHEQNWHHQ